MTADTLPHRWQLTVTLDRMESGEWLAHAYVYIPDDGLHPVSARHLSREHAIADVCRQAGSMMAPRLVRD